MGKLNGSTPMGLTISQIESLMSAPTPSGGAVVASVVEELSKPTNINGTYDDTLV